jgi:hypothetical protein
MFHKMMGNSLAAERLADTQEGLSSMELVKGEQMVVDFVLPYDRS